MITAINIETEKWNRVIALLVNEGWAVLNNYDAFDAGIDFDLVVLAKDDEKVFFGWDNWVEGEIKCSEQMMRHIETMIHCQFYIGDALNLKADVIKLYLHDFKE